MYIKTKRLEIKAISDKDRDRMLEMLTDSVIKKTYMIPDFESREQAEKMFRRFLELSLSEEFRVVGVFLNDELIGFANEVERNEDVIELGYVIHPQYHNQGFATEMLKGIIAELFNVGFSEVIAGAFEENKASIRVMEKSAMSKLDKTDKIEYRGEVHNCVYFSKKCEH